MITKTKILPCWANQKPNLKPPIWISSSTSDQIIPNPNEAKNQIVIKKAKIFKFDLQ